MELVQLNWDSFFAWLWRASWQASILILLVLGLQWLLRKHLPPRWRHALWLLVVVRLVMPWSVVSPVSLFNLFVTHTLPAGLAGEPGATQPGFDAEAGSASTEHLALRSSAIRWRAGLGWAWLAGALALPAVLALSSWRAGRNVCRQRPVTDGTVLDVLEDCKQAMGVTTPVVVVETAAVAGPSLFGFLRPRLLLPPGFTKAFSLTELRHVFLHETAHVKRGDVALNWLATLPLVLHWFNPLVWYAVNRMRVDGELACDALALSHTRDESTSYGRTIIKLLEHFSRPAVGPGLVGLLEHKNEMKRRITMIASFKKSSGWPVAAAVAFVALGIVTLTDAQTASSSGAPANNGAEQAVAPAGPPLIVATSPAVGAAEVDPAITEITVTFDRDMAGGFSWTGGGPDYPALPEGQKARWTDRRTCVLPVKLEAARYYRVGINSKSYRNFRSAEGVPALPSAIYFTTRGASQELKEKVLKPQIVHVYPPHGATDVDPNLAQITVTFNVAMGEGFSWTGGGPSFPVIPEGKAAYWAADRKTCVLPVELKPATEYRIGLNSLSHNNFRSQGGVPLDPADYTFKTRP